MKPKSNPFLRHSLAFVASTTFLSMGAAHAATYDWDGDTNSNFTNGANWVGGSWDQWSDYTFGSNATSGSVNINGEFGMNSLTLASGLTHDIVIGSDVPWPFIMGVGVAGNPSALISIDTASRDLTINTDFKAINPVTWDVGANRTLTLNGQFNNWFATASLIKNGAGTAVLNGVNGYTGATNVNGGILQVATQNGLASGSAITVASGATLSMTAASNNTLTANTVLTLNGGTLSNGGGSAVTNYGNFHLGNSGSISVGNDTGASYITGNLSLDGRQIYNDNAGFSAITVGDNSTLVISGNVTGVSGVSWGGVSKYGNGTLKLTGSNTSGYAQGMDLAAGTVEFGTNGLGLRNASSPHEGYAADFAGNATLRWATGNTQDLSGNNGNGTYSASQIRIRDGVTATLDTNDNDVTLATAFSLGGSQTGALTKAGAGTLTLTAANSYTGTTTISAGTLQIGNGGSTGSLGSGAIVNNGALVYNMAGGSVNVNKTITGNGTLSVTGDQSVNFAAGTAITTTGSQTYSATATGTRNYGFNLADDATVTLTSTAGDISMTGMLGTADSHTGNLIINTSAGNGSVILNTPTGVLGVDYGLNSLTVNAGNGTITLGTYNSLDWRTVKTLSLTGGTIDSTANLTEFTTLTVNNSDASAFSGNLTASGGALVKEGTGTLTLSGNNSYSGGTTINDGTLVASRGRLGTGAVVINDGGTLKVADQWVFSGTNPYNVSYPNPASLTVNTGGTLQLDNTGGFANGINHLYLNGGQVTGGPNNALGDLYLYNGSQQITAGGASTSTIASVIGVTGNNNTIIVGAGSALNFTAGIKNADWYSNSSTPGGIIKAGDGTLTLAAANSYTGTTDVTGGTLKVTGNNYLPGNGGITIGAGGTLMTDASNAANTQSITSTITLNGGTMAAGTGTSANNGYGPYGNYFLGNGASIQAGNTTISTISASLGLGTGGNQITVDGDSTLNISGDIFGVSYVAYGQFSKSGDGTLVLSGYNKAVSQGMILSAGTVEFSSNSLPTNIRASGGPAGYSADIQGNATLRWASGNTQDISSENGSAQVKIGDGVTATFDTNGNNVTLGTAFDLGTNKTGAVTKTGDGTLTLAGTNTYTGTTTVSGGTLVVNGSTSTGEVIVGTGATLSGSGIIEGATTISGTHAPGNSPGVQSFSGDLSYTSISIFEWDIASSATGSRGSQYDGVNVGGALSGTTGATFKVNLNSGAFTDTFWNTSQTWTNIFLKNVDGSGSALDIASVFSAVTWYQGTTNMTSFTGTEGSFTMTGSTLTWTAVPEPTSALAGLLITAGLLRRRREGVSC